MVDAGDARDAGGCSPEFAILGCTPPTDTDDTDALEVTIVTHSSLKWRDSHIDFLLLLEVHLVHLGLRTS